MNKISQLRMFVGVALLLTITLMVSAFYRIWVLGEGLRVIQHTHFPAVELNSITVRLNETLRNDLNLIFRTNNKKGLDKYYLEREILLQSLEELSQLMNENFELDGASEYFLDSQPQFTIADRAALSAIEDEAISYFEGGDAQKAIATLASEVYSKKHAQLSDQISDLANQLSTQRDYALEREAQMNRLSLILSLVIFFAIALLWYLVYRAYQEQSMERKAAQLALEAERLKRIQSAKLAALGEMAGGVAHEINNPIAIIAGFAHRMDKMVRDNQLRPDKVRDYAKRTLETCDRIVRIVKALRKVARDESDLDFSTVEVSQVIDDTMGLCRERFKGRGVELVVEPVQDEIYVRCRPVELTHVLINLLNNAYDAVLEAERRVVTLGTIIEQDYVCFYVEDTGPGIPEDLKEKILHPFFTTKEPGKGTGLGLSLSRGIMEQHEGSLEFQSVNGQTRFVAKVPRVHEQLRVIESVS